MHAFVSEGSHAARAAVRKKAAAERFMFFCSRCCLSSFPEASAAFATSASHLQRQQRPGAAPAASGAVPLPVVSRAAAQAAWLSSTSATRPASVAVAHDGRAFVFVRQREETQRFPVDCTCTGDSRKQALLRPAATEAHARRGAGVPATCFTSSRRWYSISRPAVVQQDTLDNTSFHPGPPASCSIRAAAAAVAAFTPIPAACCGTASAAAVRAVGSATGPVAASSATGAVPTFSSPASSRTAAAAASRPAAAASPASTRHAAAIEDLKKKVLHAASEFKSSLFREYFERRAREDFEKMQQELPTAKEKDIQEFLKQMEAHCALLQRQSKVANIYHVEKMIYLK